MSRARRCSRSRRSPARRHPATPPACGCRSTPSTWTSGPPVDRVDGSETVLGVGLDNPLAGAGLGEGGAVAELAGAVCHQEADGTLGVLPWTVGRDAPGPPTFEIPGAAIFAADARARADLWAQDRRRVEQRTPITRRDRDGLGSSFAATPAHIPSGRSSVPQFSAAELRAAVDTLLLDSTDALTTLTLTALDCLDHHNVELVPATLERRERKRAEKRGWPVSLTVRIRRGRTTIGRAVAVAPAEVAWTHQWEVRGVSRHVRRGPHVACRACSGGDDDCPRCHGSGLDPDLARQRPRRDPATGAPTCPDGCRREWVPAHVKGPEAKPLIPKLRVVDDET